MKLFVRTLVIALALTGAIASSRALPSSASASATVTKTSAFPVPTCPLYDPDGCGM